MKNHLQYLPNFFKLNRQHGVDLKTKPPRRTKSITYSISTMTLKKIIKLIEKTFVCVCVSFGLLIRWRKRKKKLCFHLLQLGTTHILNFHLYACVICVNIKKITNEIIYHALSMPTNSLETFCVENKIKKKHIFPNGGPSR